MNYKTFRANLIDTDGTDLFPIVIGLNLFGVGCIAVSTYLIHRINKEPITEKEESEQKLTKLEDWFLFFFFFGKDYYGTINKRWNKW